MPDESPLPFVAEVLDRMVLAGWVKKYAQSTEQGFAVDWTEIGKEKILLLRLLADDLQIKPGDQNLLVAALLLAEIKFPKPPTQN
jgi:hypothetical protein